MKLADYGAVGRAGAEAREGRDAAARLCAAPEVLRQVCVTPLRVGYIARLLVSRRGPGQGRCKRQLDSGPAAWEEGPRGLRVCRAAGLLRSAASGASAETSGRCWAAARCWRVKVLGGIMM